MPLVTSELLTWTHTLLPASNVLILAIAAIATYLYRTYYQSGLNRYPGPYLANFGKLWHWLNVRTNRHPHTLTDYHRRYGPVIRIGPTTLSISDPEYIPQIYGVHTGFPKSDMYDVFCPMVKGKVIPSLLSARDPQVHAKLHKPVARAYAMTVISGYEPLMDRTLQAWIRSLEQKASLPLAPHAVLLTMAVAAEAIMDMTFSESMGFLEAGDDVGGFLEAMDRNTYNSGLVGPPIRFPFPDLLTTDRQLCPMPWTAHLVRHNPLAGLWRKHNTMFPQWAGKRIGARTSSSPVDRSSTAEGFLDRFLEATHTGMSSEHAAALVINWCLVNILAGADTTATGLTAIIYYLLKPPEKHNKLVRELRDSGPSGILSWERCQSLLYLDVCVREGHRLHPSIALGLERDAGGLQLSDGYVLPSDVRVSMNAWVVNRQPEVFGDRVDDFVPECWLQADGESEEAHHQRINKVKRATLNFGAGTRACTGRHIAMMETYKAITALFRSFDVVLPDPKQEWVMKNAFLSRVKHVRCKLSKVRIQA